MGIKFTVASSHVVQTDYPDRVSKASSQHATLNDEVFLKKMTGWKEIGQYTFALPR